MDTLFALVILTLIRLIVPFGLVISLGTLLERRKTAYS